MVPFSTVNGLRHQPEVAHALDHRQAFVRARDRLADRPLEILVLHQLVEIGLQLVLPREALGELGIGHDQRHQVRLALSP